MGPEIGAVALLSIVIVPLVSLIKKAHWATQLKFMVSVLASAVAGLVVTLASNHVGTWQDVVALFGTSFATMQVIYRMYFEGSTTDVALTQIGSLVDEAKDTVAKATKVVKSASKK